MRIGLALAIVLASHSALAGPSTGTRGAEVTGGFGFMMGAQDVGPHDGFTAPTMYLDLGVTFPGGLRLAGEFAGGLWTRERQGDAASPSVSGAYTRFGATLRVPIMDLGAGATDGSRKRMGTAWVYAEVGLGRSAIDAPRSVEAAGEPRLEAFSVARSDLLIGFGMAPTFGLGKKRTLLGAFYSVRAMISGGADPLPEAARVVCRGPCPSTEPPHHLDVGLYLTLGLVFGR